MNEYKTAEKPQKHHLIIENRKNIHVTGVRDVAQFNEDKVVLHTEMGELNVEGELLHISGFTQDTGELLMDGKIEALYYHNKDQDKAGFFSRLFR